MTRFDEIRAANPTLALALYAMTPGGAVTLEVITPAEDVFRFTAETGAGALDQAFPPEPAPSPAAPADIFA